MMAEGDFKRIGAKGYLAWRILSSTGQWTEVYRNREKALRGFNSAILFPEQLLGLDQQVIFEVYVCKSSGSSVSTSITAIRSFAPVNAYGDPLESLEAIREYEGNNDKPGDCHRLCIGRSGQDHAFYSKNLFSGIKDAVKFQQERQKAILSTIG